MLKPKLSAEQRRALAILLDAGLRGVPERILVEAHGFTVDQLAGLVRSGYAHPDVETVKAGGRKIEVVRVTITEAGLTRGLGEQHDEHASRT